jgi:hypothetical protein
MGWEQVRIQNKRIPSRTRRPLEIRFVMRFPRLGHAGIQLALTTPLRRLRRALLELAVREDLVGTFNRRDFEAMRFSAHPNLEFVPDPHFAAVLGADPVMHGPTAVLRYVEEWFEMWGDFRFVAVETIDLGPGRFLALNHLTGMGAGSGIEIAEQEEAQLWELEKGYVARIQQWRSWAEALDAVGLSE